MSHEKDFGVEQFNKSPFSGNANIVAPHGNMITKKMTDGKGYQIFSKNCLGTTTTLVKNQRVPRCSSCLTSTGVGKKFINRQHNPVFVPHGAKTNIGIIANQPNQASHEIQRLRKFVSNAKRQIAKQVAKQTVASTGVTVTGHRADELMEALNIVHKAVEGELTGDSTIEGTPDEKENKLEMWKVMFHRLIEVYKNGGKTTGLSVAPEMMSWSMTLLARTSANNFQEVRKVLRLPHISYVYKKSDEVISSANQRAFSLCTQTCQTVMRRADGEDWKANARFVVTALDSAGVSSGVQWDYKLKKMVGQCEGHKFSPLTNKFNMMADKLKAAKVAENEHNSDATDQDEVSLLCIILQLQLHSIVQFTCRTDANTSIVLASSTR